MERVEFEFETNAKQQANVISCVPFQAANGAVKAYLGAAPHFSSRLTRGKLIFDECTGTKLNFHILLTKLFYF